MKKIMTLVATLGALSVWAEGQTYYWAASPSEYADFGTLSNWSLSADLQTPATALPGAEDKLFVRGKSVSGTYYIGSMDLGGKEWTLKSDTNIAAKAYYAPQWLCFRNGTINLNSFCGVQTPRSDDPSDALSIKVGSGATVIFLQWV